MANRDYDLTINKLLSGEINFNEVTIHAYLVNTSGGDSAYTPDFATHEFLDDVPAEAIVAGPVVVGNLTLDGRVLKGEDITFEEVPAGDAIESVLLVIHENDASDSPLFLLIDTMSGLPVTPDGGDIEIRWNEAGIWGIAAPSA